LQVTNSSDGVINESVSSTSIHVSDSSYYQRTFNTGNLVNDSSPSLGAVATQSKTCSPSSLDTTSSITTGAAISITSPTTITDPSVVSGHSGRVPALSMVGDLLAKTQHLEEKLKAVNIKSQNHNEVSIKSQQSPLKHQLSAEFKQASKKLQVCYNTQFMMWCCRFVIV